MSELRGSCTGVGREGGDKEQEVEEEISFRCSLFLGTVAKAGPELPSAALSQIRQTRTGPFIPLRERERGRAVHVIHFNQDKSQDPHGRRWVLL